MKMFMIAGLLVAAAGCASDIGTSKKDSESEIDTGFDTNIDGGEAGDTESDSGGAEQGSLTFVLTNNSDAAVYLFGYSLAPDCEVQDGEAWDSCELFDDGCIMDCSEVVEGDLCCLMCDAPLPAVIELLPGESITRAWEGRLHPVIDGYCSDCGCIDDVPTPEGLYRMTACFYPGWVCTMDTCDAPDDTGQIIEAVPDGEIECVTQEVAIPTESGSLELLVASPAS